MADQNQGYDSGAGKSGERFVEAVKSRFRSWSRHSSKSSGKNKSIEADASPVFSSPEPPLPPLPVTPTADQCFWADRPIVQSPLQAITRCNSGKFHSHTEACKCDPVRELNFEELEEALTARRPSKSVSSSASTRQNTPQNGLSRNGTFHEGRPRQRTPQTGTPRHAQSLSRTYTDTRGVESAATLRRIPSLSRTYTDTHGVDPAATLRRVPSSRRRRNSSRECAIIGTHLIRSNSGAEDKEAPHDVSPWLAQIQDQPAASEDERDQILAMASRPESMMVQGGPREFKKRAIQEARKEQEKNDGWFEHNDNPFKGKYEFSELIGKGSYGRVYKSVEKASGKLVAIKVLLPDEMDINIPAEVRDHSLQEALREINILERLQQSNAVNINEFMEAGTVHSQLWIVSAYCSGGSLTTLKRAAGNKIEERYIRIIARELAKGLASVHKAGIIHRDIKCANVMVSETGDLRIIDFGVSGVLQSNMDEDKRKTIIGTLHWMAPEIQYMPDKEVLHGSEVDVWAYGVTLYECAMGNPPNPTVGQVNRLRNMTKQSPPRLPDDKGFSADLKDLIAFCCNPDPKARPTMEQVCEHPYNAGTESEHPTRALRTLVEQYYNWERSGGNRLSLWQPGGAQAANIPAVPPLPGQDEWVFSTTADFDQQHEEADDGGFDLSSSPPRESDEWDQDYGSQGTLRPGHASVGPSSRAEQDAGARRGAANLAGLFNHDKQPYQWGGQPSSDLPLRTGDSSSSLHRKELSVSSKDDRGPRLELERIDDKKRETMAWKWDDGHAGIARPPLQHAKTFAGEPASTRQQRETLNLDTLLNPEQARQARQTMDLDALMNAGSSRSARDTMDLDALMNSDQSRSARDTMDLDALMNAGQPQNIHSLSGLGHEHDSTRDTLDLDQLMGAGPPPAHAVQQAGFAATMSGPRPDPQSNRDTLDLDQLMSGTGAALAPPFSYESSSEATIRPTSQYQQINHAQVQGTDFAQQPQYAYNSQQTPAHGRQKSQQPRPSTLDIDALMNGGNAAMLDAMMAGDHDFEGPSSGSAAVTTDDEPDYQTMRPQSNANMGFSSSPPPDSPFVAPLPTLPAVPEYPLPINPLALRDDAPREMVQGELRRLLSMFGHALNINHEYLAEASRLAPPARHSQQMPVTNGHSRATSTASSIRDTSSHDGGADGDREDE